MNNARKLTLLEKAIDLMAAEIVRGEGKGTEFQATVKRELLMDLCQWRINLNSSPDQED